MSKVFSDPKRAREAGRKGGKSVPREKRYFSLHPEAARVAAKQGNAARRAARIAKRMALDADPMPIPTFPVEPA